MKRILFKKSRYSAIFTHLFLVFLLTGCASPVSSGKYKKYYPADNPPQYLMNSGILKLERKLSIPYGDGADKMVFSHSGKYLVTTGRKSTHVDLWDMDTGKVIQRWDTFRSDKKGSKRFPWRFGRFSYDIFPLEDDFALFYPDDSKLLLHRSKRSKDDKLRYYLVDLKNPEKLTPFPPISQTLTGGSFSPDGKYFADPGISSINIHPWYGIDPFLKLHRTSDWKVVAEVQKGHAPRVVRFTPDGKYIVDFTHVNQVARPITAEGWAALSAEEEKQFFPLLRFWSVPDLKLVKTVDPKSYYPPFPELVISPDGRFVAFTIAAPYTKVFSLESDKQLFEFDSQGGLYFTSDSKYLLGVKRHSFEIVKIFSTEDWQLKEQVDFKRSYWAIGRAFNTRRNLLAISDGTIIYIWKVVTE